jgi:NAD(P)-dependent dehydrogenase (short-subunit alcohol dehydrogenase family)
VDWTTNDIPDQAGRIAVVTGANRGLGFEVTRELARTGAHVVMACRDLPRAEAARRSIQGEIPSASLELQEMDLASLMSVRAAATRILANHPRIDLLVNNAGVMGIPERRTVDGFEMQLAVNHLGHFALSALLLPALLRSPEGRVVSVTSTARLIGRPLDPRNPNLVGRYGPWKAYGQAKLANLHFGLELDRRFRAAGTHAKSLVAHPGFTHTDIQARAARETGDLMSRFSYAAVRRFGMSPREGAHSLLRAATDPAARGGTLYTPRWVNSGPPVQRPVFSRSRGREAMRTLWKVSERETGIALDVPVARDKS